MKTSLSFLLTLLFIGGIAFFLFSQRSQIPTVQEAKKHDSLVLSGLQLIAEAVDAYYDDHHQLPSSKEDIPTNNLITTTVYSENPSILQTFEYHKKDENTYKLCDTFETKKIADQQKLTNMPMINTHGAGYQCFELSIHQASTKPLLMLQENIVNK